MISRRGAFVQTDPVEFVIGLVGVVVPFISMVAGLLILKFVVSASKDVIGGTSDDITTITTKASKAATEIIDKLFP